MMPDTIKKHWIIVREPGKVPSKKMPEQSHDGVIKMLRELFECRQAGTDLTVCELTWNDDLWVSDGREALTIHDAMTSP